MHRVDEGGVREARRQLRDRLADGIETGAEVLSAVAGDQHERAAAEHERLRQARHLRRVPPDDVEGEEERVDHGVAGDDDAVVRDPFAQEVGAVAFGRREVQPRDASGEDAVGFLRPRRLEVAGAQAGLDVADRDVVVERRQRRAERGGGVALNEDQAGLRLREVAVHCLDGAGRQPRQRLIGDHQVEVGVG